MKRKFNLEDILFKTSNAFYRTMDPSDEEIRIMNSNERVLPRNPAYQNPNASDELKKAIEKRKLPEGMNADEFMKLYKLAYNEGAFEVASQHPDKKRLFNAREYVLKNPHLGLCLVPVVQKYARQGFNEQQLDAIVENTATSNQLAIRALMTKALEYFDQEIHEIIEDEEKFNDFLGTLRKANEIVKESGINCGYTQAYKRAFEIIKPKRKTQEEPLTAYGLDYHTAIKYLADKFNVNEKQISLSFAYHIKKIGFDVENSSLTVSKVSNPYDLRGLFPDNQVPVEAYHIEIKSGERIKDMIMCSYDVVVNGENKTKVMAVNPYRRIPLHHRWAASSKFKNDEEDYREYERARRIALVKIEEIKEGYRHKA